MGVNPTPLKCGHLYLSGVWLDVDLIKNRHLYLSGVWLGVDLRHDTKKACV